MSPINNAAPEAAAKIRFLRVSSVLCVALGAGGMFPVVVGQLAGRALSEQGYAALAIGLALAVGRIAMVCRSVFGRRIESPLFPAPVRAVVAANVAFLVFCALETSDGPVYRTITCCNT